MKKVESQNEEIASIQEQYGSETVKKLLVRLKKYIQVKLT